jgi:hypothetical protein
MAPDFQNPPPARRRPLLGLGGVGKSDRRYERDEPRAGEADLIIAKNRHGPTSTVTVAHQLHYSRFATLANPCTGACHCVSQRCKSLIDPGHQRNASSPVVCVSCTDRSATSWQ